MESVDFHKEYTVLCYYNTVESYIHWYIQWYTTRRCLEYGIRPETMETYYEEQNANINLLMKLYE